MKLKAQVESVLARKPATRNSDIELTLHVWYDFYSDHLKFVDTEWIVTLSKVRLLPSEDKISRIRRKFQEMGMFPATDPVVIVRRTREKKIRNTINSSAWGEAIEN